MKTPHPPHPIGSRRVLLGTLLWCVCGATAALGQNENAAPAQNPPQAFLAANEQHLWLLLDRPDRTRIFHRVAGGAFDFGREANGRIVARTTMDSDLLVFFEDGTTYRYTPDADRPSVAATLPGRAIPIALAGTERRAYAIVLSDCARQLTFDSDRESPASAQSFDPGSAPWSLVVYNGERWQAVAPLPDSVPAESLGSRKPRLCTTNDELALLLPTENPEHFAYYRLNATERTWIADSSITLPRTEDYWLLMVSRTPTLAATTLDDARHEKLIVTRLARNPERPETSIWQEAELNYSPMPEGVEAVHVSDAVGFNQHLCLVVQDPHGVPYLRFAHTIQRPAEPTLAILTLIAEQRQTQRNQGFVRLITFLLLPAVLVGLFVFRRGSMVRKLDLPPGMEPAFNMQRTAAWLIDFMPIIIAAGYLTRFSWYEGLQTLLQWAIGPSTQDAPPDERLLVWWGLSVLTYTVYCLALESIAGRTVGKMLLRVRILSETGARPSFGQILVRNATRLIELTPQFWIFVVLVLLSRNRQRLGDIFARTVLVRRTNVPDGGVKTDENTKGSDGGASPPDPGE